MAELEKLNPSSEKSPVTFLAENAEGTSLPSSHFDVVFSTCLLAHVESPERVIMEALRLLKVGGTAMFLCPTDPGLLNQFVKRLWTYPMLMRKGVEDPKYLYSQEHPNPIHNILAVFGQVSRPHFRQILFRPFVLQSWNLNLWAILILKREH
jgi:SAM-dependent methyltransferase